MQLKAALVGYAEVGWDEGVMGKHALHSMLMKSDFGLQTVTASHILC